MSAYGLNEQIEGKRMSSTADVFLKATLVGGVPFQNNTNFDIGHTDNAQNVLNIQPVYPIHLSPDWNLITRPILPVIDQPPFLSGPELRAAEQVVGPEIGETEFGLGDLTPEFFFSPRKPVMLAPP
jgi:hypothetical protein